MTPELSSTDFGLRLERIVSPVGNNSSVTSISHRFNPALFRKQAVLVEPGARIFSLGNNGILRTASGLARALLNNAGCYTLRMRLVVVLLLPLISVSLVPFFPSPTHPASLLLAGAEAAISPDSAVLRQFEVKYKHATRLQCNFLQRYSENGRLARTEAGKAYFLRPGKMRWDYEVPEKNTFLVDGKYVWFYSPVDHTATRTSAKNSEDWRTPLAFLTSDMSLSRICTRIESVGDLLPLTLGNFLFRCRLRGNDAQEARAVRNVLFEITPSGDLARIVVPQEGGIEHEFIFKDWQWDVPVRKEWFVFEPPPGVVIVDGLLPTSPGVRQY